MIRRLLRRWFDRPDATWAATGYRYTTARDYDQSQAIRKARESRCKSATGRRLPDPTPQGRVVPMRERRQA